MEKPIVSLDMRMMQSSNSQTKGVHGPSLPFDNLSDEEKLKRLDSRLFADSLTFTSIRKNYGLIRAIKAYLVRYRYTAALWLMREACIMNVLTANYEKVSKRSVSRLLAKPSISSRLQTLYLRLSAKLSGNPVISNLSVSLKTGNDK